jgi:hypothetical protein
MIIQMKDGRVFHVIKPCAFGKKPTFAYEDGWISFYAKEYHTTVTVNLNDIALVG